MRSKKIIRLFTAMLAVALCTTAFSVPASAGGGDGEPYYTETAEPEVTEEPQEEATGGMEPEGQPLTPEGNATLVDDFYGDKQLITVRSTGQTRTRRPPFTSSTRWTRRTSWP